jgi:hypothetical protein
MNVLELQRDDDEDDAASHKLTGLIMPNGQEHSLKVNKNGELEQWRTPSNFVTAFHYREGGGRGLVAKMFVGGKMQNVFEYDPETSHITATRSPVATGSSSCTAALTAGRKQGLLTHAHLVRENQLIQQLFDSEYLLNPLVAGRDSLLGNVTVHRLGWSYFQHEFRQVDHFRVSEPYSFDRDPVSDPAF